jgi:surfactin synthase thioesterase subunit
MFNTVLTPRGKSLEYFISLPRKFEAGGTYPTLLALPPGEQTRDMTLVYEKWLPAFQAAGWVFCSPVAPDGKLFFRGSERYLPYVMDDIETQLNLGGGKFYLFGVSNGGVSAFRLATLHPHRFHSVTVLPGWPKPADEKRLDTLLNVPVNFLVGELDSRWRAKSELFSGKLAAMGGDATLEIIPGQGHMAFQAMQAQRLIQIIRR